MKNGLVLEGGGMRGLFSEGVFDTMLAADISFDGIIGVSAGALFGCNYKSRQKGRALRYNCLLKDDPRYMGLRAFLSTGDIVGAEFAYHVVPFEIDVFDFEAYRSNPVEFWVVCTDIENSKPVYHRLDDFGHEDLEWLRASASMPLASKVVRIGNNVLLDGGMMDSIPLRQFQQMGYERNVVILTQPRGYTKQPSHLTWLFRLFCRKYPQIADIMKRRHEMYNSQLEYVLDEERKGNALLIFPDEPLNIGRTELNEEKMRFIYNKGERIGTEKMNDIKAFLGL